MLFGNFRQRLLIEGIMPERALLRLRREKIAVYNVKKTGKTQILLSVKRKDAEKVFAIYPNVCYNGTAYSPYVVKKLQTKGLGRLPEFIKTRSGFLLGALLFIALTLFADGFVFGVDFVGTQVYAREAYATLEKNGIKPFARYQTGREDVICAQLLALDNVEFCSVKKSGFRVRVEIRLASFERAKAQDGSMQAKHTGELIALTVLRGTALKKLGEKVTAGEELVGDWFSTETGEQVRVQIIARARIACVYEETLFAEDEESAFATAYLALGLSEHDEIVSREIERAGEAFRVKITYTATESLNL